MIRYCLIVLHLFTFISPVFGQIQSESDSLIGELQFAKDDTNKVKLLISIAESYINKAEYKKSIPYGKLGLDLSNKLSYKYGIAKASQNLGDSYVYIGDQDEGLKSFLIAVKYWQSQKNDRYVASIYGRIARIYVDQNNFEKALSVYQQSLKYATLSGEKLKASEIFGAISGIYVKKCQAALSDKDPVGANNFYNESVNYSKQALNVAITANDTALIAMRTFYLGALYDKGTICSKDILYFQYKMIKSDYSDQVLFYYKTALELSKKINEEEDGLIEYQSGSGMFNQTQGFIFLQEGNILKARESFKQALSSYAICLDYTKKHNYGHGTANYNMFIGEVYLGLGDFLKAETHLLKAVQIFN
ncbi:MAG: tetratricopeptide repeat protein, partial [Saprospiraceae bacterium]